MMKFNTIRYHSFPSLYLLNGLLLRLLLVGSVSIVPSQRNHRISLARPRCHRIGLYHTFPQKLRTCSTCPSGFLYIGCYWENWANFLIFLACDLWRLIAIDWLPCWSIKSVDLVLDQIWKKIETKETWLLVASANFSIVEVVSKGIMQAHLPECESIQLFKHFAIRLQLFNLLFQSLAYCVNSVGWHRLQSLYELRLGKTAHLWSIQKPR